MSLTKQSKAQKFAELDNRIKRNLIQAGEDLETIQVEELFLGGGFASFKEYCEALGKNYHWAWRQITAAKTAKTLPDASIRNVATAQEVKKIALPQRRQVVSAASEQSGGKLTAPAIKKAVEASQKTAKLQLDGTGMEIPPEIQSFWNRNEEVQFLLGMISKIKTTMEKADDERDPLYAMIDRQGCVSRLKMIYEEINAAKSFAVCPKCNGVFFSDCEDCRKRGTLGKFHWGNVPQEIKALRET